MMPLRIKKSFWFASLALVGLLVCAGLLAGPATSRPDEWPRWRGPFDNGMARGDAPTKWSDTENVKWKREIPGKGHSSPVVWGDKIFLTTAIPTELVVRGPAGGGPRGGGQGGLRGGPPPDRQGQRPPGKQGARRGRGLRTGMGAGVEHQFAVMCLDRNTGKVLWQKTATTTKPHEGYHRRYGSFASNSPVTDGKHVFAFFGSRGIYAYDLDGNLAWEKHLGVRMQMRNAFGEGIAPVLHEDTLILTFDQEADSFIVALDKRNGQEKWRAERDEISNWAAPLVVEHAGGKQVLVSGPTKVRSYDFETGKLIWECAGLGSNTIPSPVQQGDVVYVMSGHRNPNLLAIRLGREGDLTGSDAVLWTNTRGNPYVSSPVLHDNKLYLVAMNGFVSCLNASTGEPYYRQVRLPKPYQFKASPVGANGKLYLATEDGDVVVLKMGEEYEVIAINTLANQIFIASPAIVDGEIFLRGQNTLFCISGKN